MALKKNQLIFVVEDNQVYNKLITGYLSKQGYSKVKTFFSGEECVNAVEKGEVPEVVIQDYFLENMNGLDVLKKVKKLSPESEFVFLTNNESMEVAVNTIKYGAYDYIIKDRVTLDKVVDRIQKISKFKTLKRNNKQIRQMMVLFTVVVFLIVLFAFLYFVVDIFGVN
jgi:DNA-binding NtrC family response regulator